MYIRVRAKITVTTVTPKKWEVKNVLEKELEAKFKKQVEKYGAKVWKFVSPGKAGAPDRIVLIPGGQCVFAEIKRPGERPRRLQEYVMQEIGSLGFGVWVIDSFEDVDRFCGQYFC